MKITYYGSEKEILKATSILNKQKDLMQMKEPKARLKIQELIDKHDLKASILINNNTVWSKRRILRNLERLMKHKTLYNPIQEKPPFLSHYFYQFLHLCCGSIAHCDIHGWIHKYPTIEELKQFFAENESGKRVIDYIPKWNTDARAIVEEIDRTLHPFQSYLRARQ